jgi:phosphatidate cytidylyltransferase
LKTRILVAAIGLPFLFAVIFLLQAWCFGVLVAVMAAIGSFELMRAVQPALPRGLFVFVGAVAALTAASMLFSVGETAVVISAFILMAGMSCAAIHAYGSQENVGYMAVFAAVFGGALIPYFLSTMTGLRMLDNGRAFVLLPMVSAFVSDSGAYFSGKFLGKRKAFPYVSPHKTVEGCVGGFVAGVAGVLLYGVVLDLATALPVHYIALLVYGIVGNFAAQLGDLTFSLIKRQCGIKDYGHLLPGHGGILDRFDSMIFVAPVLYWAVQLWPAI